MEARGKLVLRFLEDDDGLGKLLAQASSKGFSGEGAAWFSIEKLQDFAKAVATYPLSEENSPCIAGGFFKKNGSGDIEQEHLAIKIYPVGLTGRLGVQVRIATELWDDIYAESQHKVVLEIATNYEPIARFSKDLNLLLEGRILAAVLEGEL